MSKISYCTDKAKRKYTKELIKEIVFQLYLRIAKLDEKREYYKDIIYCDYWKLDHWYLQNKLDNFINRRCKGGYKVSVRCLFDYRLMETYIQIQEL